MKTQRRARAWSSASGATPPEAARGFCTVRTPRGRLKRIVSAPAVVRALSLNWPYAVTGIPRLDEMLGGKGVYRGSSVLVSGTAGTGKSSFAAHFTVVADEDAVVSRRFFGFASPPERYEIIVIPPDPSQSMHNAAAPER